MIGFLNEAIIVSYRVPDGRISQQSYPLLARELIKQFIRKRLHGHQAAPAGMTNKGFARQFGVRASTIQRWHNRDDVLDRSHIRHNILATLTSEQEEIVIAARVLLRLGLDDLLLVAREFLSLKLSLSALQRILKRRDVPTLAKLTRRDME